MPIADSIRVQLAPHIKARGQTAISKETGIPQPNLSAWLAGRRPMSLDNCVRIAEACGLRLHIIVRKPRN